MDRNFHVIVEQDDDGYYVADVPELPGCHTQARSLDDLIDYIQEAIELCLDVEGHGDRLVSLEFVWSRQFTAN